MSSMLCPACKTNLVPGNLEQYETLDEHICDPNGEERPLRQTYVCPNVSCFAHTEGTLWAYDGEGPYGGKFTLDDSRWIDSNPCPFNSYHRQLHFQIYHKDEDKRIKLSKHWTLEIHVRYQSNDHGDKVGRVRTYQLIKDGVYYMNGIKMLVFTLKQFYKERKYGRKGAANDMVNRGNRPNAAWWARVAAWYVKVFHKKELTKQLF